MTICQSNLRAYFIVCRNPISTWKIGEFMCWENNQVKSHIDAPVTGDNKSWICWKGFGMSANYYQYLQIFPHIFFFICDSTSIEINTYSREEDRLASRGFSQTFVWRYVWWQIKINFLVNVILNQLTISSQQLFLIS